MKKILFAAVAATSVVPLSALAQSTVTLYGRLNVSAESVRFSSTSTRPNSHLNVIASDASLWGIRGTEDLGGGSRAYFKLESGFLADTGAVPATGPFFSRESYVGLGNTAWGSLQLGSQWAPALWQSVRADPFQRFGPGGQPYLLQGARGYTLRYDNAVQYLTPSVSGFSGRLYYAFGEAQPTGRAKALSVDYESGPMWASLFHERYLATAAAVGLAPAGPAVAGRTTSVAGTYDFGVVKAHAQYQANHTDGVPNATGYLLGLTVPVGPAGQVRTSYVHRKATNADASQIAVGYWHSLSKRTVVFTNAGRLTNKGTAAFRIGPALTEQGALGANGPVAGQGATAFQVGVMHSF